ncbi:MAG: hypothetical protein GYB68_10935 [Chloroflexi bacterium]|nr:hypothetical protein [Chloroflexota bacterium]
MADRITQADIRQRRLGAQGLSANTQSERVLSVIERVLGWYNRRHHSSLEYLSSEAYERRYACDNLTVHQIRVSSKQNDHLSVVA